MADKRADRASQFIPFDALKGFREALRQKEKEVEKEQDMLYINTENKKTVHSLTRNSMHTEAYGWK